MTSRTTIELEPSEVADETLVREHAAKKLGVPLTDVVEVRVVRRSLDARRGSPKYVLTCDVGLDEPLVPLAPFALALNDVTNAPPVAIIGCGPAGLFAALKVIEGGYRPIVLERGKPVRERRRDIAALTKEGIVDEDSNYCFGEGGAGTFSDGKLYTRSTKRGSVQRVLEILHLHGAHADILVNSHAHIGTNRLPYVVQAIRQTIVQAGGEVRFSARVTGVVREAGRVLGVRVAGGETIGAEAVIVATGHSARDVYDFLLQSGVSVQPKPFALGVRIEHPQALINERQYRGASRREFLPPAAYSLKCQVDGRGVFSFCMCPGGVICPSATRPGEIVTNGWSPSKRNSRFANSGLVVQVSEEDLLPFSKFGPLAAMKFQESVEKAAFTAGGGGQVAPAQRVGDFVEDRGSTTLPECSYIPGITSAKLSEVLPQAISRRLRDALRTFNSQMRGYVTNDAVMVATESRTSAPVRIPRDPVSGMHPECDGLFPAGEGAGYAGGIVSAAMDGEFAAESALRFLGSGA